MPRPPITKSQSNAILTDFFNNIDDRIKSSITKKNPYTIDDITLPYDFSYWYISSHTLTLSRERDLFRTLDYIPDEKDKHIFRNESIDKSLFLTTTIIIDRHENKFNAYDIRKMIIDKTKLVYYKYADDKYKSLYFRLSREADLWAYSVMEYL